MVNNLPAHRKYQFEGLTDYNMVYSMDTIACAEPEAGHSYSCADRRSDHRLGVTLQGRILVKGCVPANLIILDISKGGIGAIATHAIDTDKQCLVAFNAPLDICSRRVTMWGRLIYSKPEQQRYRIGISFLNYDTASKNYLCKMLENLQPRTLTASLTVHPYPFTYLTGKPSND